MQKSKSHTVANSDLLYVKNMKKKFLWETDSFELLNKNLISLLKTRVIRIIFLYISHTKFIFFFTEQ